MIEETESSPFSRALVPTAALLLLADQPAHGYALVQRLRAAGFTHVRGGTLYPQLRAMEEEGSIDASWATDGPGPARKVYRLTSAGSDRLDSDRQQIKSAFDRLASLGA